MAICALLCCVQLSSSDKPCFVLHAVPISQDLDNQPTNTSNGVVCAGEGLGLQVFPGRVAEVTQVIRVEDR
jgi:hypothetical protein